MFCPKIQNILKQPLFPLPHRLVDLQLHHISSRLNHLFQLALINGDTRTGAPNSIAIFQFVETSLEA